MIYNVNTYLIDTRDVIDYTTIRPTVGGSYGRVINDVTWPQMV